MAKIKYLICVCKDCESDFLTREGRHCPICADNAYVERERTIWIDRPVIYKRPWTEHENDFLIESVKRGISNQSIADELNRTKDSVAERLRRLRKKQKIVRGIYKGVIAREALEEPE